MPGRKEEVLRRLREALDAAIDETRRDPEFIGRVVSTICSKFGVDALASAYIANKVKSKISNDA